jgi:hypothetical protein
MKLCFVGLFLAGFCFGQSGGEATLSGHITDAATHQLIEGAEISCLGGPGREPAAVKSDANGAYSIRVPAGRRVGLAVSKSGFSPLDLRSSDRTELRLNPGDSETRDFELSRPGSISGHLVDRDTGKPLAGFYIHAIHWFAGLENSTGFRYPAAPTSGDGSFSIADLPPAGYALVVDPPMGGRIRVPEKDPDAKKKDETGYGPTWYPGVPQPDMATPIALGYAENRRIEMRLQKHELLHIAGTLQAPEGAETGVISITLTTEAKGRPTGAEGEIPHAGPFRIDGLEPGSYRVLAAGRLKDGQTRVFASRLVELAGHSVDDLAAELRPGVALQVVVKVAEEKAEPPKRFSFVPLSTDGWGPIDDGGPPGDSKMYRTGLPPGNYNIAMMQMPGYAVASTALNGTALLPGAAVDLESPESVLTVVLTTELGSVTGVVKDSEQKPVAEATVALAPELFGGASDDRLSLPPGAGETTVSDGSGRFAFNGLAPGRYRAIALPGREGLRPAADAGLIRERMRTAEVIVVLAGQSTGCDLLVGR